MRRRRASSPAAVADRPCRSPRRRPRCCAAGRRSRTRRLLSRVIGSGLCYSYCLSTKPVGKASNTVTLRKAVPLLLALGALVAAGCGGASDSNDATAAGGSGGGGGKTTLSLIGYSTPEVVYDEVIPAFEKTAAGKGVS